MRRLTKSLLVLALLGAGCGESDRPATATAAVRNYCGDDYVEVERRIDRLLGQLTLEQKIFMTRGEFPTPDIWTAYGAPELGIPDFVMTDGPRGAGRMLGNATAFPVAMARGATFDPELERRIGETIGIEVRSYARNVLLAPTMNVLRHPLWGRAQETYGEDPFHIGEMALGFIAGAQTQVPVTAKHFAVNSIENTRHTVNVTVDERTLREIYLPHFRRVVQEGRVAGVMSAYNSVNGAFCSENPDLLRDILKGEWQFAGFVVSDWGGTEANVNGYDHTIAAATAGLDLEMFVEKIYGAPLFGAIESGALDESVVDEMIRRQLRARFCYALDTDPPVADATQRETPAARALAREAAGRSMVLLHNSGGALPVTPSAGMDIVVTGPLADFENLGDTGSSSVTSGNVVTALEGLMAGASGATITHLAAPPATPAEETVVADADAVVVVIGLSTDDEGEAEIGAGDRDSLALPAGHAEWVAQLAALSDRVIVIVEGGSALDLTDVVADADAVVMAWYPGVEGGHAIADVVFGSVNPSGRLPIVFPAALADLPPFDNVSDEVTYGYFHGYRHLDDTNTAPLFPFGYGLSYTTFAYSNLVVEDASLRGRDTLRVTVDVENTGSRPGRETVQLYVGAPSSTISPRAARDLRAFAQVEVPAGETRTVALEVPVEDLGTWDVASQSFRVEATTYRVEVGSSSRDLPLFADVAITP